MKFDLLVWQSHDRHMSIRPRNNDLSHIQELLTAGVKGFVSTLAGTAKQSLLRES